VFFFFHLRFMCPNCGHLRLLTFSFFSQIPLVFFVWVLLTQEVQISITRRTGFVPSGSPGPKVAAPCFFLQVLLSPNTLFRLLAKISGGKLGPGAPPPPEGSSLLLFWFSFFFPFHSLFFRRSVRGTDNRSQAENYITYSGLGSPLGPFEEFRPLPSPLLWRAFYLFRPLLLVNPMKKLLIYRNLREASSSGVSVFF